METTEKKISDRVHKLPKEIKDLVLMNFFDDVILEIVEKYHITERQKKTIGK